MTRLYWPLRHRADSGAGWSGFPILPLRENPAHTKAKDKESKSRRITKKESLSTEEKLSTNEVKKRLLITE
jgi:hypothetical protein